MLSIEEFIIYLVNIFIGLRPHRNKVFYFLIILFSTMAKALNLLNYTSEHSSFFRNLSRKMQLQQIVILKNSAFFYFMLVFLDRINGLFEALFNGLVCMFIKFMLIRYLFDLKKVSYFCSRFSIDPKIYFLINRSMLVSHTIFLYARLNIFKTSNPLLISRNMRINVTI